MRENERKQEKNGGREMKIVINRCYGGFGLSPKATKMIMERKGLNCYPYVQTKYEWRDGVKEYTKTGNSACSRNNI